MATSTSDQQSLPLTIYPFTSQRNPERRTRLSLTPTPTPTIAISQEPPSVTHAASSDIPEILSMLRALAATSTTPTPISATEASLSKYITFATTPTPTTFFTATGSVSAPQEFFPVTTACVVKVLLLRLGDAGVAGMAIYYPTFSTWKCAGGIHLEDLYVKPEYRGKGYGEMLVRKLGESVEGRGRLEWVCEKGNTRAVKLYESLGAERMEGWVGFRLEGEGLERLKKEG